MFSLSDCENETSTLGVWLRISCVIFGYLSIRSLRTTSGCVCVYVCICVYLCGKHQHFKAGKVTHLRIANNACPFPVHVNRTESKSYALLNRVCITLITNRKVIEIHMP